MHNQPGVIPILLTDGKADAQDRHPETGNVALHEAAERGHIKCVQVRTHQFKLEFIQPSIY